MTAMQSGGPVTEAMPPRAEARFDSDRVFRAVCRCGASAVIVLAALLVLFLVAQSLLAMRSLGFSFLTHTRWDPVHSDYGALAFVYGTVATSALAMLGAVPLGVATAAYLAEIAPGWLRRGGSFLVELLAAIPSVVYGVWGLLFLVPLLQHVFSRLSGVNHDGTGVLAAGTILGIMIVPYITAVSYDVCRAVPQAQREAAFALGATRWQMIWSVILPYARPGILGACFLALGRALGETMAVTMLIGNRPVISLSPFTQGDTIASVIANQLNEAGSDLQRSALVELGLLLLLVTIVINCAARMLIWRVSRPRNWAYRPRRFGVGVVRPTAQPDVPDAGTPAGEDDRTVQMGSGRHARWIDWMMTGVLAGCFIITVVPLFLILGYITYSGAGALNWDFFVKLPPPGREPGGGMAHAIYGSAMIVSVATVFAVPIGLLSAILLAEYRTSRLAAPVRFIGELLGGVPSIVVGIFAYALIVVPMGSFSGWAGAFALGILMIPIVMRASEEALKLVPQSIRNASYALGANQRQTILQVVVPAALTAIVTGIFLAVARIAGETAPLLLTAGNSNYWPSTPGDRTPFLPYYIYLYSRSGYPDWERQAWAAAFVLLVVVMFVNIGIRLLAGKRGLDSRRAD